MKLKGTAVSTTREKAIEDAKRDLRKSARKYRVETGSIKVVKATGQGAEWEAEVAADILPHPLKHRKDGRRRRR
jgi:hypothetical protein